MGLGVCVGLLADLNVHDAEGAEWVREDLKNINDLLAENGLPTHAEPESLPTLHSRAAQGSFPYSFLHYLRRFAAYATIYPNWTPTVFPATDDPVDDPVVEDAQSMLDSHLLCHSDCVGYYVPVAFDAPLFSVDESQVPGGMLGSSQGLMTELVKIAPALGITLLHAILSDAEAERVNLAVEREEPFWIEMAVWLKLFEAARLSIEHNTAISFG